MVDTPSSDIAIDVIAAAFAKAAELHKASLPGATTAEVSIITTSERKQILADRAEAERLEKERIEREAATAELEKAVESATASRDPDVLTKPLRRARRAVEVDAQLIDRATTLKAKCEEERRLERERVEREAATAELKTAISTAKQTRDAGTLTRPLRRAKKAVDVDTALIGEGESLKSELEAEKKEKERQVHEPVRFPTLPVRPSVCPSVHICPTERSRPAPKGTIITAVRPCAGAGGRNRSEGGGAC